jgi:preprotein translocase subunit SecA
MAGRGTDIPLGPGVNALGGLHVICCQFNATRRIDRQLRGRAGRRGEPGSIETMHSLEAPLLAAYVPRWLATSLAKRDEIRPRGLAALLARLPQRLEQARQRAQREQLLQQDLELERGLAFGGRGE